MPCGSMNVVWEYRFGVCLGVVFAVVLVFFLSYYSLQHGCKA